MSKIFKMEHSKYSIEYEPDTMVIKHIYRGDEDVTKELNFNIVRDLFYMAVEYQDKNKITPPRMVGYSEDYDTYDAYECPNCGNYFFDMSNFCPECGCKWREIDE